MRPVMCAWTMIKWTGMLTVWFVTTIMFTYGTCLYQGHCGTGPWNSISHSWENPPGSYLSRFVVGFCCNMIYAFHGALYLANNTAGREPDATRPLCRCWTNEVLLVLGLFGTFCLSWVAAICDADDDPLCLGNNTIHSFCAVTFFALTDVIAGVLACHPRTDKARNGRLGSAAVAGSMALCTAVRACAAWCRHFHFALPPFPYLGSGDNFVILAEVAEVVLFCVFMNNTAWHYFDGLSWAAVTTSAGDPSDPGRSVQVVASAPWLAKCAFVLALGCVVLTLVVGEADGTLPPGQLPPLSALGTHKPCNWLWRNLFVQAASAGCWGVAFAQEASAGGAWKGADWFLLLLGLSATLCMAGMAIVNEDEQPAYHAALTAAFFVAGDAYALAFAVLDRHRAAEKPAAAADMEAAPFAPQAFAVLAAFSAVRFALPLFAFTDSPSSEVGLEWVNAVALLGFFYFNVASRPATETMGLAYVVDAKSSEGDAPTSGGVVVTTQKVDLF